MIEFELSDPDLLGVRFAISPLNEMTMSLRALADPGRFPMHLRWLREVLESSDRLDLPVLENLWTPWSCPDFLSPRPVSPLTRLEDELADLLRTPPEVVREQIHEDREAVPPALAGPPERVLERIVEALAGYWEVALAGIWPRMRTILEADIVYRGRVMTTAGLGAMLSGLSERVTFESPVIRVDLRRVPDRRTETGGEGLTLLPSLFTKRTAVPIDPSAPPMITYAARGLGALWERGHTPPPTALAGVLGEVRAGLLAALAEPTSSTDVAVRSGVTTSAANQHLRAMRDAGLLMSYRNGRSVLYARTELGDALVRHAAGP